MDCNSGLMYCGQAVSSCLRLIFGFACSLCIQISLSKPVAWMGAYGFLRLLYVWKNLRCVALFVSGVRWPGRLNWGERCNITF